jgi:hypothetical protein
MRHGPSASEPDGQVCSLFAVDIAGFTGAQRDNDIQVYVRQSLYKMLDTAFNRSDVPWSDCSHEDRGDGAIVVVPSTIPAARIVPIPDRLRLLIRLHNRVSCDGALFSYAPPFTWGPSSMTVTASSVPTLTCCAGSLTPGSPGNCWLVRVPRSRLSSPTISTLR